MEGADNERNHKEHAPIEPRRASGEEVIRMRTSLSSSRASSLDGEGEETLPRASMGGTGRPPSLRHTTANENGNGIALLGNGVARQSHVDLHSSDPDAVNINRGTLFMGSEHTDSGGLGTARKRPGGGLQAKSGIIIVSPSQIHPSPSHSSISCAFAELHRSSRHFPSLPLV